MEEEQPHPTHPPEKTQEVMIIGQTQPGRDQWRHRLRRKQRHEMGAWVRVATSADVTPEHCGGSKGGQRLNRQWLELGELEKEMHSEPWNN